MRNDPGTHGTIESILRQLRMGERAMGWRRFLDAYAPQLLKVVRHHVRDEDGRGDCFLHVCEKLADDDCRRLLAFDPTGRAQFPTWLTIVATRLCIDWIRHRYGRERPFANVARLTPLQQRVFHFRFERCLDRGDALQALIAEFPGLDHHSYTSALATVESTLTTDQRWRLSVRSQVIDSLEDVHEVSDGADVENGAAERETHHRLASAMAQLEPHERLLLQYRFEQDLTFDQIGKLTGLGDPFRARRAIDAVVKRLRILLLEP